MFSVEGKVVVITGAAQGMMWVLGSHLGSKDYCLEGVSDSDVRLMKEYYRAEW